MKPSQPANSLSTLPEHRQRALARELATRMQAGATREAVLADMKAEQTALGVALLDPEFVEQVGTQMLALMGANSNQLMPDGPTYMRQILERRVADTQRTLALLDDAAFVEKAAALKPEELIAPSGLAPEKREEMIRRLVQEADPEGAEPAIHIASAAIGHRQVHQALAELFKPEGTLAPVLTAALARAWPEASDAQRSQTAANWLNARHNAAITAEAAFSPEGEVLREALARSRAALAKPAAIYAPLLASTALNSTKLSQAELEARKNDQHKAEDIIYTLNHAITCLSITDFLIAPFLSSVFGLNICNHHDHGNHEHHDHKHHDHAPKPILKRMGYWWHELTSSPSAYLKKHYPGFREWVYGEVAGDVGAVPITIALQRFAPGFMNGIRQVLEPVTGWAFKRSTSKSAKEWGAKNGYAADSQEVVDHAQKLYDYEMRHIPQMAVWTAASVAINYGVMKTRNHGLKLKEFAEAKVLGTGITAGLVLGARTLAPEGAHKWDQTVGKNVIVPISKKVGGLFGVEDSEIDEFHKRQREDRPQGWAARTQFAAADAAEQSLGAVSRGV